MIKCGERARAIVYDWVRVILGLCGIGGEMLARKIVDLLQAVEVELNGIEEMVKDVSAYIKFVRETGVYRLKKNELRSLSISFDITSALQVSNVYGRKVVKVL